MNNRKLFVGNVGYSVTENELRDLFAQVGNVESVNIVKDKFTGNSRGFAFVEMSSSDEARQAVQDLNNKDVGGRSLKVSEARSRENRDSNGSGSSNRGGFSRR
ncbi:RNA-binding protein [Candidatus Babeliales bacterium]|nr:RNA-binding protein [Candidatus Babeliales bacterium]